MEHYRGCDVTGYSKQTKKIASNIYMFIETHKTLPTVWQGRGIGRGGAALWSPPSAAQLSLKDQPNFQGPSNDQREEQSLIPRLGKSFSCSPAVQLQTPRPPSGPRRTATHVGLSRTRTRMVLVLSEESGCFMFLWMNEHIHTNSVCLFFGGYQVKMLEIKSCLNFITYLIHYMGHLQICFVIHSFFIHLRSLVENICTGDDKQGR